MIIGFLIIGLIYPDAFKLTNQKEQTNNEFIQERKEMPQIEAKIQEIAKKEIIPEISDTDRSEIFDIDIANSKYNLFLPKLHIDIHVYSEVPSERFIFINMKKYTEGETLIAGPTLETITIEGAILSLKNTLFLLPKN